MSHHVGICLTTLKSISLRWNMVQYVGPVPPRWNTFRHVQIVQLCWYLSHHVWISPTTLEYVPLVPLCYSHRGAIRFNMLKYAPLCWKLFQNVGIHSTTLKYVSRCWNLPNSFRLCPTTLENLSICWNLSHQVWIIPTMLEYSPPGLIKVYLKLCQDFTSKNDLSITDSTKTGKKFGK